MGAQQGHGNISKCSVFWLIIFSAILTAAAVILVVLLATWGDTGLAGSGSIVVGTCSEAYFSSKYSNMGTINSAVFICCCMACLTSTLLLLIFIGWICKACCKGSRPSTSTKGRLFFLISMTIMASIAPLGYYLSFLLELSKCSNNTINTANLFTIILLAALLLLFAFIVLVVVLCQDYQEGDAYRQVQSAQTEHNEEKKQQFFRRNNYVEDRKSPIKMKEEEHTKEKIFVREPNYQSPPRRKEQERKIYLERKQRQELRNNFLVPPRIERSPQYRQQSLTMNLHPTLRNIDLRTYVENNRTPNRHEHEDESSFNKQSRKYYDYDRRGILARGDFEERDRRDRGRDRNERYSPQRSRDRDGPYAPEARDDRYNQNSRYRDRDYRMDSNSPNRYSPSQDREGIMKNFARRR